MRPLRLLLSLSSCLAALTLLLYIAFGSRSQHELQAPVARKKASDLKALFSFTSPASLFPPSAIISLTDDNSTFFLARPAAFGPLLSSKGLSGPLWIGSGFGDDTMGRGELGCSDVPGWSDGDSPGMSSSAGLDTTKSEGTSATGSHHTRTKGTRDGDVADGVDTATDKDGTDDYLHLPLSSRALKSHSGKTPEHADIQSLQEGAEIAGKVVLLKRGGCGFLEKTKWAQRRGGIALIVGDDVRGGGLIRMYAHGDTSNITITSLFTSHTTAHLLSSLLPSGGFSQDLSPEDAAKLKLIKSGKGRKDWKDKGKSGEKQDSGSRPTYTRSATGPTSTSRTAKTIVANTDTEDDLQTSEAAGWLRSLLHALGFGNAGRAAPKADSRRPPSSGNMDWVLVENWDDDRSGQKPIKSKAVTRSAPTAIPASDGFVIGEQDWRDPDLLPPQSSASTGPKEITTPNKNSKGERKGGGTLPTSGEYGEDSQTADIKLKSGAEVSHHKGWFSGWFGDDEDDETLDAEDGYTDGGSAPFAKKVSADGHSTEDGDSPDDLEQHEGLWVTLTPTNMSSSPFFDTLLVLVVSPLVTLTVVYALLLLRSRIRRRRWRAPKSVVERLPVRTYHTISDTSPPTSATPANPSPTTPLLQHTPSRPISSLSRPRSRTTSEVPATSSSFQQGGRTPEEKREAGLAEWRRRYGGRQKECVVCLEEYEDGVSRVMSLPCGHEFHADCITPWLVTRRRTCPICKGDVVRSLSQSYQDRNTRSPSPSPTRSPRFFQEDADTLQVEAAETRNDSPSAARPVPIPSSAPGDYTDDLYEDVEANWEDGQGHESHGQDIPRDRPIDLSGSLRDLSSTVTTTIWRGFDAIRGATGLQRRPSQEEVDRDR